MHEVATAISASIQSSLWNSHMECQLKHVDGDTRVKRTRRYLWYVISTPYHCGCESPQEALVPHLSVMDLGEWNQSTR